MEGQCKLCRQNKTLLNKSHILPDFIYRDLMIYNSGHMIKRVVVKSDPAPKIKYKDLPNGEYEGGILCQNCDNMILGSYENYAKKIMFDTPIQTPESPIISNIVNQYNIHYTHCENIDYRKFKIFLLSLLWRMTISTRKMYAQVIIPPTYEEMLRTMIINGDPGNVNDFPVYGWTYLHDKSMPRDIIGQPFMIEIKGVKIVRILIGGIFLLFHVSVGEEDEKGIFELTINTRNEWNIFHIKEGEGLNYFFRHAGM